MKFSVMVAFGSIVVASIIVALAGQSVGIPYFWIITTVLVGIIFFLQPFYFLLSFLAVLPFSYLTSAGPDTSILKPLGIVLVIFALPAILFSKSTLKLTISPLGMSIIVFIVGCFFSLFSFIYTTSALWGLIFFLGNALFYGVCVTLIDSIKKVKLVLVGMLATFSINALIGILQKTVFKVSFRALGTVQEPNYFALILLPFVPIALTQFWSEKKLWLKILYGISAACLLLTIPLTISRSGIIVLGVILVMVFIHNKKYKQLLLLLGAAAVVFFLLMPKAALIGLKWSELTSALRMMSVDFRFSLLKSGMRMFFDHPILGVGADNFIACFHQYSFLPTIFISLVAHNTYLEILTGSGLVGFIPFAAIIFFGLKNYLTAYRTYKHNGDAEQARFVAGVGFGFLAFLMGIFFLTAQHHILLWFFLALSTGLVNSSRLDHVRAIG